MTQAQATAVIVQTEFTEDEFVRALQKTALRSIGGRDAYIKIFDAFVAQGKADPDDRSDMLKGLDEIEKAEDLETLLGIEKLPSSVEARERIEFLENEISNFNKQVADLTEELEEAHEEISELRKTLNEGWQAE